MEKHLSDQSKLKICKKKLEGKSLLEQGWKEGGKHMVNGKIISLSCQNNYDQLQKQVGPHPSKDPFTILDEKCGLSFYFLMQMCNSHKL
jgi:hypothetical protein